MEKIIGKKFNNKGFTLVELIVVLAIMAILTTVAFYSIRMITSAKGKDCAIKIENVFNKTRVASQTKAGEHSVSLYVGEGNAIIVESTDEGVVVCGKHGVTVTYQLDNSSEEHELGPFEERIIFNYNQNTGSFNGLTYDNIKVYANGNYWLIKFYKNTGKLEVTKHPIEK